jgi:hypothetical protein
MRKTGIVLAASLLGVAVLWAFNRALWLALGYLLPGFPGPLQSRLDNLGLDAAMRAGAIAATVGTVCCLVAAALLVTLGARCRWWAVGLALVGVFLMTSGWFVADLRLWLLVGLSRVITVAAGALGAALVSSLVIGRPPFGRAGLFDAVIAAAPIGIGLTQASVGALLLGPGHSGPAGAAYYLVQCVLLPALMGLIVWRLQVGVPGATQVPLLTGAGICGLAGIATLATKFRGGVTEWLMIGGSYLCAVAVPLAAGAMARRKVPAAVE